MKCKNSGSFNPKCMPEMTGLAVTEVFTYVLVSFFFLYMYLSSCEFKNLLQLGLFLRNQDKLYANNLTYNQIRVI